MLAHNCPTCAAIQDATYASLPGRTSRYNHVFLDRLPALSWTDAQDGAGRSSYRFRDPDHYIWVPGPARTAAEGKPFEPNASIIPPPPEQRRRPPREGAQTYTALFDTEAGGHAHLAIEPDPPPITSYHVPLELDSSEGPLSDADLL